MHTYFYSGTRYHLIPLSQKYKPKVRKTHGRLHGTEQGSRQIRCSFVQLCSPGTWLLCTIPIVSHERSSSPVLACPKVTRPSYKFYDVILLDITITHYKTKARWSRKCLTSGSTNLESKIECWHMKVVSVFLHSAWNTRNLPWTATIIYPPPLQDSLVFLLYIWSHHNHLPPSPKTKTLVRKPFEHIPWQTRSKKRKKNDRLHTTLLHYSHCSEPLHLELIIAHHRILHHFWPNVLALILGILLHSTTSTVPQHHIPGLLTR